MIKKLNQELEEQGYLTVAGRVSRKYYIERTYSYDERYEYQEEIVAQMGGDTNLILKTFEKVYNLYKMNCLSNKSFGIPASTAEFVATSEVWE